MIENPDILTEKQFDRWNSTDSDTPEAAILKRHDATLRAEAAKWREEARMANERHANMERLFDKSDAALKSAKELVDYRGQMIVDLSTRLRASERFSDAEIAALRAQLQENGKMG